MRVYRRRPDQNSISAAEQIPRERLAQTALVLGVASLAMMFFFPVLLPYIPASVAIILAILSKGSSVRMDRKALAASVLGIAAIALSTGLLVFSVFTLISISKDPERLRELNEMIYRMYGMNLDQLLEQAGLSDLHLF